MKISIYVFQRLYLKQKFFFSLHISHQYFINILNLSFITNSEILSFLLFLLNFNLISFNESSLFFLIIYNSLIDEPHWSLKIFLFIWWWFEPLFICEIWWWWWCSSNWIKLLLSYRWANRVQWWSRLIKNTSNFRQWTSAIIWLIWCVIRVG